VRMFRCPSDEALGSPIDRFIPARFRAAHHEHVQRFGSSGQTSRAMGALGAISGLRADGDEFPIEASISKVETGEGALYTVILRDITARLTTEDALKQAEERLRLATESAEMGIWNLDLLTGENTWDLQCKALFEFSPETDVTYGMFLDRIHPADRALVEHAVQQARDPNRDGGYAIDYRVIGLSDGQERWIRAAGRVWFEEHEGARRPLRFTGTAMDITGQKAAEQALYDREEQLRGMFDQAAVGIVLVDRQGRFTAVNDRMCELLNRTRDDLLTYDCGSLTHPDDWSCNQRFIQELVVGARASFQVEKRYARQDGSWLWVHVSVSPLRDRAGAVKQLMAVVQDISARKQADVLLQRQADLLNQTHEAVMMWKIGGGIVFWNRGAEALYGWRSDAVVGRRPHDVLSTEAPQDIASIEAAIQSKGSWDGELEHSTQDGHRIIVESRLVRVRYGEDEYVLETNRDITERKQAEARLYQMADAMPQIVWSARPDGYLDYYNARWYAFTGAVKGAGGDESWKPVLHPDDVQQTMDAWYRAVQTGEPYEIEYRFRDRETGAYRWHLGRALPVRDPQGTIVRWFGTCTDIDEFKRTAQALKGSEERLRLSMAAGKMGGWEVDLRTGATHWDTTEFELTGLAAQGVGPHQPRFYSLVHPEDRLRLQRAVTSAIERRGGFDEEFRIVRPDGTVRWLAGKGLVITDANGQAERLIGVNFDVTDRKEGEARLQGWAQDLEQRVAERTQALHASQKRLRAFATELNLAEQRERKRLAGELHDHLAQLLVLGRLQLGQAKRVPGTASQSVHLIGQTEDVLNEALTYTRTLVADLSPPVLREFGLPAALTWLAEWMQRHGLSVTVELESGECELPEEEAVLMFQSVRELLMNAAKHAGTNQVGVQLQCGSGELTVTVQDKGKGFDLAMLVDQAPNDPTSMSSKFGLFSVQERMQALGGRFEIISAPGRGTTATLTLPLPAEPAQRDQSRVTGHGLADSDQPSEERKSAALQGSSRVTGHPSPSSSIRVLLVDDHAMVRQGLRSVLEGYADVEVVGEAADGEEAVVLAERLKPSVVVMDINMPKKNGIDATAEIKARHPEIVVIGLSVNAAGENQSAMRQAGAAVLLTKEAAVEELYGAIVAHVPAARQA
jgi:PAS domain S-box-containing protein